MDFQRIIKMRMVYAALTLLLGVAAIAAGLLFRGNVLSDFHAGFYSGTGGALLAYAIVTLIRQAKLLNDDEKRKKAEIDENDERTRFITERSGNLTSRIMLPLLYVASLVAGFFSPIVFFVLLSATAVMIVITITVNLVLKAKY